MSILISLSSLVGSGLAPGTPAPWWLPLAFLITPVIGIAVRRFFRI